MSEMNCDLYQNPYRTRCSGSISPDGEVSVCWRHLAESRDDWMAKARYWNEKNIEYVTDKRVNEQDARIEELERRCADKDASIAQLIEQLQKAEAQLATQHTHPSQYDIALTSCPACYPPFRTSEGAK